MITIIVVVAAVVVLAIIALENVTRNPKLCESKMTVDKNFYNSASAAKLGWDPSWFGCNLFDEELIVAVAKWQKSRKLTADGMVGPTTYRRILAERQSLYPAPLKTSAVVREHIVHNGRNLPIAWDKVVLWNERGGLVTEQGAYNDMSGKPERKPTMFVNHWDACLTSNSCADVLKKRNISVHFCIDNDGTIYQLLDTQHVAWHAGDRKLNHLSIGVEISNAYYTKYQDWYIKNGFGERPIVKDAVCHGVKIQPFLGFYPVQLKALQALWKSLSDGLGIPLVCPVDSNKKLITTVDPSCESGQFKGFVNHYNLAKRKTDCAGLDLVDLLKQIC